MAEETQTVEIAEEETSVEEVEQKQQPVTEEVAQESPKEETVAAETESSKEETPVDIPEIAKELIDQGNGGGNSIDLLQDVDLNVKIELGRTKMYVEDVLKVSEGSVIELDKLAGDPVDIYVNERLVARGEVLVLNDNFCVRVNQITIDQTSSQ